jgi:hypothetical protein
MLAEHIVNYISGHVQCFSPRILISNSERMRRANGGTIRNMFKLLVGNLGARYRL